MDRGMCPTGTWSAYTAINRSIWRRLESPRTHHLLDLDLLEWTEATCTSLHVECTVDPVLLATLFVLTIEYRLEFFSRDVLEGFRTTGIACIRVYTEKGLNFGDACDNASYSDEVPKVCALHITYGHGNV